MLQAYLIVLNHPIDTTCKLEFGYVKAYSLDQAIDFVMSSIVLRETIAWHNKQQSSIYKGFEIKRDLLKCTNVLTIDQYNKFLDQITGSD